MAGGRPPADYIAIGKEFVKWATNNPEALTVPMFACSIGLHSGIMRNWAKKNPEFNALFIEGKEQIGINRLRATLSNTENKLDSSIYRAHVHNYDQDLKAEWREEKEFDSSLRQKEEGLKATTINLTVPHDLGIGLNLPASTIPVKNSKGSKSGD
jgi:hypothetical protein